MCRYDTRFEPLNHLLRVDLYFPHLGDMLLFYDQCMNFCDENGSMECDLTYSTAPITFPPGLGVLPSYQAASDTYQEEKSMSSPQSPISLSKLPRGIPNIARFQIAAEVIHLIPLAVHPGHCTKNNPVPWLVLVGPHVLNLILALRIPGVSFSISENGPINLTMRFDDRELADCVAANVVASERIGDIELAVPLVDYPAEYLGRLCQALDWMRRSAEKARRADLLVNLEILTDDPCGRRGTISLVFPRTSFLTHHQTTVEAQREG